MRSNASRSTSPVTQCQPCHLLRGPFRLSSTNHTDVQQRVHADTYLTTSIQQSSNLIKSDLGTQCLHFKRTKLKSMLPDISDCALHNHRVTTKQDQLQKNKKLILCESCLEGQRRLAPRVRVGFWSQLQERRGRVTLVFKCLSTRSRLTPPLTTSCEHSKFTLSAPLGFDTRPHQKQTTSKDAEDFSPELNKASVNVRASFLRTSPLPHEAY